MILNMFIETPPHVLNRVYSQVIAYRGAAIDAHLLASGDSYLFKTTLMPSFHLVPKNGNMKIRP